MPYLYHPEKLHLVHPTGTNIVRRAEPSRRGVRKICQIAMQQIQSLFVDRGKVLGSLFQLMRWRQYRLKMHRGADRLDQRKTPCARSVCQVDFLRLARFRQKYKMDQCDLCPYAEPAMPQIAEVAVRP